MLGLNRDSSQTSWASSAGLTRGETAVASRAAPLTLHVVGRDPRRENADICGEYRFCGKHSGYPAYMKPNSNFAIRFWAPTRRWVIDRDGLRDADVCVAYADAGRDAWTPNSNELVWNVWDSRVSRHVADEQVMATDAPLSIKFVGRHPELNNSACNGEYELQGLQHGKPWYVHKSADLLIRYYGQENRWMIGGTRDVGNICMAYADGDCSQHPACPEVKWNFWAPEREAFMVDERAGAVVAPSFIHVLGRSEHSLNTRINGSYELVATYQGRPLYFQRGTEQVIRYTAKSDSWLIQCDDAPQPNRLNRFLQWMFTGDSNATEDTSTAFAKAHGKPHPAHALEWQVYNTTRGTFEPDSGVIITAAPLVVNVSGREDGRAGNIINGTYTMAGALNGCPYYKKVGEHLVLYYYMRARWNISRSVSSIDSGVSIAYADDLFGEDHPGNLRSGWHVWEDSRGRHLLDSKVSLTAATDAPQLISDLEQLLRMPGTTQPAPQGRKRYHEDELGADQTLNAPGDYRRCAAKAARTNKSQASRIPPQPRSWLGA